MRTTKYEHLLEIVPIKVLYTWENNFDRTNSIIQTKVFMTELIFIKEDSFSMQSNMPFFRVLVSDWLRLLRSPEY